MSQTNSYDRFDVVRRESVICADGPAAAMKIAAYRVRDPETNEFGPLQFHMTYNNTVMAVMGAGAAKLFCDFVTQAMENHNGPSKPPTDPQGAIAGG